MNKGVKVKTRQVGKIKWKYKITTIDPYIKRKIKEQKYK